MSNTSGFYIDKYVDELLSALSYIHSIDGFLIKLGTIVHELEETCRDTEECNVSYILERILSNQKIRKKLSQFACYVGDIVETITTDPRHKILRKYVEIIRERLESIECIKDEGREISVTTPEALWVKEEREKTYFAPQKTRLSKEINPIKLIYIVLGSITILFIISLYLLMS